MRVQGIKYDMMILNIKLNISWSGRKKMKKKPKEKCFFVEGHAFFKRNEILRFYRGTGNYPKEKTEAMTEDHSRK